MKLERVLGVLLLLGLLAGGTRFAAQYFEARGQIVELEDQRDDLLTAQRTLTLQRDSARAVGDTIGQRLDSLSEASVEVVEELADTVELIVERIVEIVPDSVAEMVVRIQTVSQERVTIAEARAERAEDAVVTLRRQLFDERELHDMAMKNAQEQIASWERQDAIRRAMAPGNFIQEMLDDPIVLAVGVAIGASACLAFCR